MSIPRLNFSDITSGPKTGLGDGLGSGAIVTVWGNNLGSSKGSSTIKIGGVEAAYVYYWGNATGALGGGPADLYTYHKMQEISFSIPAGVADGLVNIEVTVDGVTSNTLPFTVRVGDIYFVKTTGTDGAGVNGSWSTPWRTITYVGDSAGGRITAGATIYISGTFNENTGVGIRYMQGTPATPYSLIAYPGSSITVQGTWGIANHNYSSSYWNISKIIIKTQGDGIGTFKGMRAVGNEVTNYPGYGADGQNGAISGGNYWQGPDVVGDIRCFGNYIHDFGDDNTSKFHHVFYITNRSGNLVGVPELGWNHLSDNKAPYGLHMFDEAGGGDFSGTLKIHDNVVNNQVGSGFDISTGGSVNPCFSFPCWVYNNIFINCGQERPTPVGYSVAISVNKYNNQTQLKFFNNIVYGYGATNAGCAIGIIGGGGTWGFGGTWDYYNNIVVDLLNNPYTFPSVDDPLLTSDTPDNTATNLWYNGGDSNPASAPSWDVSPLTTNPLFTNAGGGDFSLQSGSPAKATGTNMSAYATHDLLGNPRSVWDMGAIAYTVAAPPPTYGKTLPPIFRMMSGGL